MDSERFRLIYAFLFARKGFDESGVQENLEEEEGLMELLRSFPWNKQALPPLSLGSAQGALSDKFHTVMQALFLIGAGITSETRASTFVALCPRSVHGRAPLNRNKKKNKQNKTNDKHKQSTSNTHQRHGRRIWLALLPAFTD